MKAFAQDERLGADDDSLVARSKLGRPFGVRGRRHPRGLDDDLALGGQRLCELVRVDLLQRRQLDSRLTERLVPFGLLRVVAVEDFDSHVVRDELGEGATYLWAS